MNNIKKIEKRIQELKKQLKLVKGTDAEVYTRIVGYHRSVPNWNKGKKEEYYERTTFSVDQKSIVNKVSQQEIAERKLTETLSTPVNSSDSEIRFYKLFYSDFCINCPPVKNYLDKLDIEGEKIDVSTDLGMDVAKRYGVMSTPYVILLDKDKNVIQMVSSVTELENAFLNNQTSSVL